MGLARRVLLLGCLAVLPLAAGGNLVQSASIALGFESVSVPLGGRAWRLASRTEAAESVMAEWVLPSEDARNWTELLSAQAFDKQRSKFPPPEEAMAQLRTVARQGCAETVWAVLERRADGVLYEWRTHPCPAQVPQHQIARIFDGRRTRFRVAYTARTPEMAPEQRSAWIKRLATLAAVTDQ